MAPSPDAPPTRRRRPAPRRPRDRRRRQPVAGGRPHARRPAAAADRQRRLRRAALRHRPRDRPAGEHVHERHDDDDRDGHREPRRAQPRLPGPGRRLGAGQRQAGQVRAGRVHAGAPGRRHPADEARRPAAPEAACREDVHGPRRLLRRPAAGLHRSGRVDRGLDPRLLHAGRRHADLRLVLRRRRADGLPGVVPVEQPPVGQGDVRHDAHRADGRHRARRRRARRRSDRQRRRHDHLALERGRPDRDLPRHRVERRVRLQRELDDGDADRPDAAALQRDRPVGDDRPAGEHRHGARADRRRS